MKIKIEDIVIDYNDVVMINGVRIVSKDMDCHQFFSNEEPIVLYKWSADGIAIERWSNSNSLCVRVDNDLLQYITMSDSESDSELIGRKHQELQALAYFTKKRLVFEYDSCDIPEFEGGIRSRPDFLFRGELNVIVEIDENAHVGYPPEDEVSRMVKIWKAFNKNILFIRVAIDREKELTGSLLKEVYKMILDYRMNVDTRSRMLVHYINYPIRQLEKYRRFNGIINIVNFEDVESLSEEEDVENLSEEDVESLSEEEDITSTTTVTTVTTTTTIRRLNIDKSTCNRCGFNAARVRNLRTHLIRKKVCKPKDAESDIPRENLLKLLDDTKKDKKYVCSYCSKLYMTEKTLANHKKICSLANEIVPLTREQFDNLVAKSRSLCN